ncbi:M56 family metallopeptidase [Planctomyces sp. SH-PL62]|uniref:M56 family metallopeptidase n=1 Tax=Planctomyces sp. SH-PL62 TaxID=1636152 RepID=UPI00078D1A2C|nr:M56 family metallopeptidase [Planctomyces sp. SH-PL62]AMV36701.1 Protease HtpX [Planctomyces sp. SH-PL62]
MLPEAIEAAQGLIWPALLHSVWLGLAAASVAALAANRLESHRARHAVFLGALVAVAIGSPSVAVALRRLAREDARPTTDPATVRLTYGVASTPVETSSPADSSAAMAAVPPHSWPDSIQRTLDRISLGVQSARPFAMAIWAAGALAMSSRLLIGLLSLRRLRREARPKVGPEVRVRVLARRLRLRSVPTVLVHEGIAEPCLAGVFRPIILLPSRWLESVTEAAVDAVLAHELAHARRLDHVTNLTQRGIEACFFFHLCVAWLSRSARRESEHAADALAARLTGDPLALALALESVARNRPARPSSIRLGLGLPIGGDRSTLLPRIQELLGMKPSRPRLARWPFAALPAAFVAAILAASVGLAQEPTPPRPPDPAKPAPPALDIPADELARLLRAEPESLSREDLVKRLRNSGRGGTRLNELSREEMIKQANAHMITYEVAFLEVDDEAWKRVGKGRLEQIGDSPGVSWLVTEADLAAVLDGLAGEQGMQTIQAPRISCFEEAQAHVISGPAPQSAALLKPREPNSINPFGLIVALDEGRIPKHVAGVLRGAMKGTSVCRLTGSRLPDGHRIEARVASSLGTGVEYSDDHEAGPQATDAPKPFDEEHAIQREVACNVPDGSGLVIDAGIEFRVRGASAPSSTRTVRNLVAVIPRHVLTEAEEAEASKEGETSAAGAKPRK